MQSRTVNLKVDFYTRAVLTTIAICLMGILLRPLFTASEAEAGTKRSIQDVNIAKISGHYLSSPSATIRVKVEK